MNATQIDRSNAQLFLRVQRHNAQLEPISLDEFPALWRKLKADTDSFPFPREREDDMKLHEMNHRFAAFHQYFYYQTVNRKITSEYIEDMIDLKCNQMHKLGRDAVMRLAADINQRHGIGIGDDAKTGAAGLEGAEGAEGSEGAEGAEGASHKSQTTSRASRRVVVRETKRAAKRAARRNA